MEKIQELIDAKKYEQVIKLLSGKTDQASLKFLIMAYFNSGDFLKAIESIDLALTKDEKNYYWLIRHKIEALIELQDLNSAYKLVETELKMPYIPKDYVEYFETLGIQLKNQIKLKNKKDQLANLDEKEFINLLLKENDEMNLLVLVDQFNYRNVRTMIDGLQRFYSRKSVPNYIKMSLTEILKTQDLNQDFEIINNDSKMMVNPTNIEPLFEQSNFKKAIKLVDSNPFKLPVSQKEIIYELIIAYLANLFPKVLVNQEIGVVVAGAMILSSEMLGETNKVEPILHYTGADKAKVEPLIKQLKLLI